jgi:hypothetical protein
METSCGLCHQLLNPDDPDNWKEVRGWVGGPKQDSMRLRSDTGELAHDTCVLAAADGQVPGASDLFAEDSGPVRTVPKRDDPADEFFQGY